jgi:hypothetical protein
MKTTNVSWRPFIVLALLTVVCAGCQTSRTPETNSASTAPANTEAAKQTAVEKPSLSGKIENISLYPVPNNRANLAVSLVVSVSNTGTSSNAQDWTLAVKTPGRYDLRGLQPVHVNGVVTMPGAAGERVDLDKEDLAIKSKEKAIAKGETLSGILTFVLAKTSATDLSNNNSTLVIHFKDSRGNSYQTGQTTIGAKR